MKVQIFASVHRNLCGVVRHVVDSALLLFSFDEGSRLYVLN